MNAMVKWVLFSVILGIGSISTQANAGCFASAQIVERILSYDGYSYLYLRPKGALTNAFYYYVRVNSDMMASTAANAQTDRSEVNVYGDAATCPTSGVARYMGIASYVYILN